MNYFKNKTKEEKFKIIKGLKEKINENKLFFHELFNILPSSSSSYFNDDLLNDKYIFPKFKESTKESSNILEISYSFNNSNILTSEKYTEEEINIINEIYQILFNIKYCPGNTEEQRKFVFEKIYELLLNE